MSRRWSSALIRRVLVSLSPIPQAVIANSHSGLRAHQALGYRPQSWTWIPNSVDSDRFHPQPAARIKLRNELGVPEDAPLIGLVARLDPMKDHGNFVAAAKLLAAHNPDLHFVLAGHRVIPGAPELTSLIESAGMKARFHLLGLRKDIHWITAGLDLACSSSAYGEGSSNAVAEAMACGIPCVVTDVGDSASIVGSTGKVVPPRDSQALANACEELLALPATERIAIGALARERVAQRFSPTAVADFYQQLYEDLNERAASHETKPSTRSFGESRSKA